MIDLVMRFMASGGSVLPCAAAIVSASPQTTPLTLTGGALPQNVFWQSAGDVSIGTTAHFEGVMLAKTLIAVKTGATVNGRLLAQTEVTLQKNTVTQPAEVAVVSNNLSTK